MDQELIYSLLNLGVGVVALIFTLYPLVRQLQIRQQIFFARMQGMVQKETVVEIGVLAILKRNSQETPAGLVPFDDDWMIWLKETLPLLPEKDRRLLVSKVELLEIIRGNSSRIRQDVNDSFHFLTGRRRGEQRN